MFAALQYAADDIIYTYAGEYDKDRLMKLVVDVNYNVDGNRVSLAKSVGLVDRSKLAAENFYEILWGKL